MLAWLLAAVLVLNTVAIAAAYYIETRDRSRERPRLDDGTREILRGWTED